MKTIVITATLLLSFLLNFSNAASGSVPIGDNMASSRNTNETSASPKKVNIKLLTAEEAHHNLQPLSTWMEVSTSDKQSSESFKLLDNKGIVIQSGSFRNGKVLIDVTTILSGKYLVVVGERENRTIQPLQLF